MKQTLQRLVLAFFVPSFALIGSAMVLPATISPLAEKTYAVCGPDDNFQSCCQGEDNKVGCDDPSVQECANGNCLYVKYVNPIIGFLSAVVGLAVTIGIIIGGIKYASAGGDPSKVAAAKKQITISIVALVSFGLLWAFLNWILPGGING